MFLAFFCATFAEEARANWWDFSGGCATMDYWLATSVTLAGKDGGSGYKRYVNVRYTIGCLPN